MSNDEKENREAVEKKPGPQLNEGAKAAKQARLDRSSEALRQNLLRRKAQQRARRDNQPD